MSNWLGKFMLFHYGNCKQEIDKLQREKDILRKDNTRLNGELHESKAIYNYQMSQLEKEIESLKKQTITLSVKDSNVGPSRRTTDKRTTRTATSTQRKV